MNNLTLIKNLKSFILNHKKLSIIALLGIVLVSYLVFFKSNASTEIRYITGTVAKGDIASSVSGSGQVKATDTVDINSKTSGTINYVAVKVGQEVREGALIASVDSRDAKIAVENAEISLAKLKKPSTLTTLQKENSLSKSYNDGWNNISSFVIDMETVVAGINDLHGSGYLSNQNKMLLSKTGKDKLDISENAYWDAKRSFDSTVSLYKTLSRTVSDSDKEKLINQAFTTSKIISNAVKLSQASFDYAVNDLEDSDSTQAISTQSDLTTWKNSTNGYVDSIALNLSNIKEYSQSLADTLAGADELDIRQAELNLETKRNAYNDLFIRAPFDGVIASIVAKVGQSASGSIGALITKQKLVTISLNEVDIAKIKLGQKATLTFDAISDLIITGKVVEIDSVGTVSQGVVTYNVSISLDVDDARVKPGMSVSATITTDMAPDVIIVPNNAVKTKNGTSYVEVFSRPLISSPGAQSSTSEVLPTKVSVETGLVDDTSTEIISGLKEGDIVVIKTVTTAASKASSAPSILGAVGGSKTGTGSGAMRAIEGH